MVPAPQDLLYKDSIEGADSIQEQGHHSSQGRWQHHSGSESELSPPDPETTGSPPCRTIDEAPLLYLHAHPPSRKEHKQKLHPKSQQQLAAFSLSLSLI